MTPSERVACIVRSLDLAPGHFFLGGSACLALRDLRHVGDLDVGVTTRYWHLLQRERRWHVWTPDDLDDGRRCDPPYLETRVGGTEVNVFHSWRRRHSDETAYNDYNLVFREGIELVNGWPCLKLPVLLQQKADAVSNDILTGLSPRPKDLADIALIVGELS